MLVLLVLDTSISNVEFAISFFLLGVSVILVQVISISSLNHIPQSTFISVSFRISVILVQDHSIIGWKPSFLDYFFLYLFLSSSMLKFFVVNSFTVQHVNQVIQLFLFCFVLFPIPYTRLPSGLECFCCRIQSNLRNYFFVLVQYIYYFFQNIYFLVCQLSFPNQFSFLTLHRSVSV